MCSEWTCEKSGEPPEQSGEIAETGGCPLEHRDIEPKAPYLLRETIVLSNLGGTAEYSLPSLNRDGGLFILSGR